MTETDKKLIAEAKRVREFAYCPYSNFAVGAAVLGASGEIYGGCNIENSSYGATCCAERTALFSAAAKGKRKFSRIAVVGSSDGDFSQPTPPCGICRQVLSEFCKGDFEIILTDKNGIKKLSLSELLPFPFEL